MPTLNLGILAHVDAGKTSLTERLLFAAGVIDEIGRVDDGSTQTDTMALERQRGITIKAAVVSFALDELTVNLIDTPGHPDFIAEVDRALSVLDGAVLVISAVEGVQSQTRVLMRALRRSRLPVLIFVNKIDRAGAACEPVLRNIADRLTPAVVPMGTVHGPGTRDAGYRPYDAADPGFTARLADLLAEHDDALLAAYIENPKAVSCARLRAGLAAQTGRALVHPVFFGSAMTGAGVAALTAGIKEFLPPADGDPQDPPAGVVFKADRGPAGERITYVRMFSGTVRVRDRLPLAAGPPSRAAPPSRAGSQLRAAPRVTGLSVFEGGSPVRRESVAAGQIATVHGLSQARIGDTFGSPPGQEHRHFSPPTLETVVVPARPAERGTLLAALTPNSAAAGSAVSGVRFALGIELGALPLAFLRAVQETVHATLRQGLHGWPVTDVTVTLTQSGYYPRQSHAHARFDKAMSSTAADFRGLTPLVLMAALGQAGTRVHEPVQRFHLEIPADTAGAVLPALARLRAVPGRTETSGPAATIEGSIRAARVRELEQQLPGLTRGEGVLECVFGHYEPVRYPVPSRPRSGHNPLNRAEYLRHVTR